MERERPAAGGKCTVGLVHVLTGEDHCRQPREQVAHGMDIGRREGVGVDNGLRRKRIDLGRILLQVGPSHVEVLNGHPLLRLGPSPVSDQHLVTTLMQSLNNSAADEHRPPEHQNPHPWPAMTVCSHGQAVTTEP